MTRNVGNTERAIRFLFGAVLLGLGFYGSPHLYAQIALIVVGIVAILTAAAGFCPAWRLFGVNTCKTR